MLSISRICKLKYTDCQSIEETAPQHLTHHRPDPSGKNQDSPFGSYCPSTAGIGPKPH
jgi:hypothetical protein